MRSNSVLLKAPKPDPVQILEVREGATRENTEQKERKEVEKNGEREKGDRKLRERQEANKREGKGVRQRRKVEHISIANEKAKRQ